MKKLLEEPWCYTLYQDGEKLVLSALCGTVAMFDRNLVLNDEETTSYNESGKAFIDELASAIRDTPNAYEDRHVDLKLS